jgi:hypothetical protein
MTKVVPFIILSSTIMTDEPPKQRPKIVTWGDRMAWLGRMPMKYRILFGTQAIIFGLAINFRMMDVHRSRRRNAEQKATGQGGASSSPAAS